MKTLVALTLGICCFCASIVDAAAQDKKLSGVESG